MVSEWSGAVQWGLAEVGFMAFRTGKEKRRGLRPAVSVTTYDNDITAWSEY